MLRSNDGGALIREMPDGSCCSLNSSIHLVGFSASSDLQQGDVPDIGSVEDSAIFLKRLEIGMSSTPVEFASFGKREVGGGRQGRLLRTLLKLASPPTISACRVSGEVHR